MIRVTTAGVLSTWAGAMLMATGFLASATPAAAADEGVSIAVTTVPVLPNATLRVGETTVSTDAAGEATIRVASLDQPLPAVTVVDDGIAAPDREAQFSRWWGLGGSGARVRVVAVFDVLREVTWRFLEGNGRLVDPSLVSELVVRSSHGDVHRLAQPEPMWLHATRAVPSIGGLVARDIEYRIESVVINGAEVVIRNQQKFVPAQEGSWPIRLLFFDARFSTRDALLGVAAGTAIQLQYPSGRVVRHPVDGNGELSLRLPRGSYRALVEAPGMRVWTPVALSRDQEIPIQVLTYLDMGLVGGAVGAIALGLLFAGRPHLVLLATRRPNRLPAHPAGMRRAPAVVRPRCPGGCVTASPVARFCRFCGNQLGSLPIASLRPATTRGERP